MRKVTALIIAFILLLAYQPAAIATDNVSVILNGNIVYFDASPCIVGDRAFVPVRGVLERLGINVDWDSQNKMMCASNGSVSAWFQVNNSAATFVKNGGMYVYHLNASPMIISDRLFVPVRAVAEIFGVDISWDGVSRAVIINAPVVTNSYQNYTYTNTISLNGFVAPQQINVGQAYVLYGEVMSDIALNRVNVKIKDKATGAVEVNETRFDIYNTVYPFSDIDSRVKFGILSLGQKTLEITAVNQYEQRRTFTYDFEVKRPGGAALGTSMEMLWPVPSSGLITTIFWCDNVFCHSNDGRVNGHAAIDIAANENADVIAVQGGVVRQCGFGDSTNGHSGYGNFIEVDHGNGVITQYAHLYSIYVTPGQAVSAGQVIGGVGNTGNSTGNHLDFSIESNGTRCDPLYYLNIPANARCYESCDVKYFDEALRSRGIVR